MDDSSLKIPTPAIPPVKPALKHPAKNDPMESDDKKEKHLTWDEHAIEEHDVLRGTRMKVGSHLSVFEDVSSCCNRSAPWRSWR